MYIYLWPELTFAYQEQKSDNASATFLFSLECDCPAAAAGDIIDFLAQ